MLLTLAERVLLTQSFPSSGTISIMKSVRSLREKLEVDRERLQTLITTKDQVDESKLHLLNEEAEVDLSDDDIRAVKVILFESSKAGRITEDHLDLCEKFGVE